LLYCLDARVFSSEKPFENESNVKIAVIESNKFYEKFGL